MKLVVAWDSQNSFDASFYAAQIGFYLTIVVVLISMVTLIESSNSRNDIMLIRLRNEVKSLRKISEHNYKLVSYNNTELIDVLKKFDTQLSLINSKNKVD